MTTDSLHLYCPTGILEPGGWEHLAALAQLSPAAGVILAGASVVRIPALSPEDCAPELLEKAASFGLEVVEAMEASGTANAAASVPSSATGAAVAQDFIGWFDQEDGTVTLGASVAGGFLDQQLLQFLHVVNTPSTLTAQGTLQLHELSEGAAEQVVRVLAPMGLNFDARRWPDSHLESVKPANAPT